MFVLWLYSHFRVKDEKAYLCFGYISIFVLKDENHVCALVIFPFSC